MRSLSAIIACIAAGGFLLSPSAASANFVTGEILWENLSNHEFEVWEPVCGTSIAAFSILTTNSGNTPAVAPANAGSYNVPGGYNGGGEANWVLGFWTGPYGQFTLWTQTFVGTVISSGVLWNNPPYGMIPVGDQPYHTGEGFSEVAADGIFWSSVIQSGPNIGDVSVTESIFGNGITNPPTAWVPVSVMLSPSATPSAVGGDGGTLFAGDFDDDGLGDLVWWDRNNTGNLSLFLLNADGTVKNQAKITNASCGASCQQLGWSLYAAGDVNCDDQADLVWWNRSTGQVGAWWMGAITNGAAEILSAPTYSGLSCGGSCADTWWLAGVTFPGNLIE